MLIPTLLYVFMNTGNQNDRISGHAGTSRPASHFLKYNIVLNTYYSLLEITITVTFSSGFSRIYGCNI